MNINNNSEENKPVKEPIWVTVGVLAFVVAMIYFVLYPLVVNYWIFIAIIACLVISWLIEIKLTSDMKYTGWFAVIFVIVFFYSGAAGWDW